MKTLKRIIPLLVMLPIFFTQLAKANDGDTKVVKIKATDQMRFSVTEIEAKPGQTIKVELTGVSDFPKMAMSHNFVLLKADADAMSLATAAAQHSDNDYIPPKMTDEIIAHTPLAGGGDTVTVTFKAPEKPGSYQYICTFPGHFASGMKGTLEVSNQPS